MIGVAVLTMVLVFINVEIGTTIVLAAITVGMLVVAGTQAEAPDRARRRRRSC